VDLTFLGVTVDMNYVILGMLMYAVGLVSVMAYRRLQHVAKRDYRADDAVVEAVVSEYTRRLRDYDRAIAEMRAKIDIVESRSQLLSQPHSYMQPVTASQPARMPHAPAVSEPVAVTQRAPEERMEGQNGTTDYILKLLAEKPRTSREVQHAIGRTREHTARLMKKLTESGLVSRDTNSKPFRYGITEAGQARLREKPAAPEIRQT
jgi:predicted transcriptional regulator